MATIYKVLGQQAPAATTETALYTVPGATDAVCSSIIVCNRAASADSFRISVSVGGGATANKDYIYYNVSIPANDTFIATVGITLDATDVVRCYSTGGNCSFSLYGSEIS